MFQVIGDEIRFEGYSAARFEMNLPPTVRDDCEEMLHAAQREEEDDTAAYLREKIDAIEAACKAVTEELSAAQANLNNPRERKAETVGAHLQRALDRLSKIEWR